MAVAALDGKHLVQVLAAVQHGAAGLEHDGALGVALSLAAAESAEDELPAAEVAACAHAVRRAGPGGAGRPAPWHAPRHTLSVTSLSSVWGTRLVRVRFRISPPRCAA